MASLGLTLFIISTHIQYESDINWLHRIGAVLLSFCALVYIGSAGLAFYIRSSSTIPLYLTGCVAGTTMIKILVFGIAKGAISQHLRYNVAIAIFGYRSAKLVSLEESLQPIQLHIHQLPLYVQTAKKWCHFPSEHGLTRDESASIYIYTMEWGETSLYRVLNKVLRDENRDALTIWFSYLKLFDSALDKLPPVRENVWRGVSNDIGKNFSKNQQLTWWSVNSCSSSVHVIKHFLGNEINSTIFLIETSSGKKISGYTDPEQEDEVILKMGTDFRVQGNVLEHPKDSFHVHLVEINDEKEQQHTITSAMNNLLTRTILKERSK
ncbi:hypothetical protein I4U23_021928 [Adineta vaga]|nr:hypothetical protein I4U23_021928 [Adineta vaga]